MDRNSFSIVIFSILILSCYSCKDHSKPFFYGELKQINFEKKYHVEGEFFETDSVGNLSLQIVDRYLILTTYRLPHFAKIYDRYTGEYFGEYFYEGQGPADFLSFQIVNKDYPFIYVRDSGNKTLNRIDLQETLSKKNTVINKQLNFRKVVDPLCCFYISDECLLIKDFEVDGKGIYYMRYNPETENTEQHFYKMYNYPVSYHILGKIAPLADCISQDGKKIASLTFRFDQIDILDLENPEKNVSVTTAEEMTTYDYINETHRDELKDYYHGIPVCSGELVFCLYYNHYTDKDHHEIHVIDWNGNPKFKLITPGYLTGLDVDIENGILYGLGNERVYSYDIKEMLLDS